MLRDTSPSVALATHAVSVTTLKAALGVVEARDLAVEIEFSMLDSVVSLKAMLLDATSLKAMLLDATSLKAILLDSTLGEEAHVVFVRLSE